MKKYIIALDEGTTSCRSIIFDSQCNIVSVSQKEFSQIYPNPGWVEQDPMEIYTTQHYTLMNSITSANIDINEIAGIGITNQRETTILWDKETGEPVYNAIVWQCRRTSNICEQIIKDNLSEYIKKTTGLTVDAYFSGTKIKWILDNVPNVRERAEEGKILFGTVDTWLIWKLTKGKVHITDYTNASRTMIFDISKGEWDEKLLKYLNIPKCILPEVKSSSEIYGELELRGVKIPICGIAGDQQSALFGQGCFYPGEMKNTYGTGCFLLANTGNTKIESKNGLVTTIAATLKGEPLSYALEGSVFIGGAIIKWLRDELKIIKSSQETEGLANSLKDNGGVYIVPAFAGLGAPYWNMNVRGAIFGLTRGSNYKHITRAALESIAFQTNDLIKSMEADFKQNLTLLKVDGGASQNNFLMQFQSSISNITIQRPASVEATAMGAAYLAGLAVGFFKNKEDLKQIKTKYDEFNPRIDEKEREKYLKEWQQAINSCMSY